MNLKAPGNYSDRVWSNRIRNWATVISSVHISLSIYFNRKLKCSLSENREVFIYDFQGERIDYSLCLTSISLLVVKEDIKNPLRFILCYCTPTWFLESKNGNSRLQTSKQTSTAIMYDKNQNTPRRFVSKACQVQLAKVPQNTWVNYGKSWQSVFS